MENVSEFNTSLVSKGLRDDGIWQKNNSSGDSDDMLYGIFQLWDQLVCGKGTNAPNVCAINCMGEYHSLHANKYVCRFLISFTCYFLEI